MPATARSGISNIRLSIEPQRALLTPSASPSVGPPDRPLAKRPRLRSTPSSSISATPSTSNESGSSADFNSARRASTLRVLNTWAQLAERYTKRLDEDDIVDLYSCTIIRDRGVLESAHRDYHIGHIAQPDDDQDYPDGDQEDSEQEDDGSELGTLPPSDTATDDDPPISRKELLRGVPPLSATTDAEDLREFLEAEKKRRMLAGDKSDEDDIPPERLVAIRNAMEEHSRKMEAALASQAEDMVSAENPGECDVDATPTRSSTRAPPSDDESEDELALWTHDESSAIYPVVRDDSEQEAREAEHEVIELTDLDSDEEFEAILTRPPHLNRLSPPPAPHPKEVQQPLRSPPDSAREKSKSRVRGPSKINPAVKFKSHPRSSVPQKPEDVFSHKRGPSVSNEAGIVTSIDVEPGQAVIGRVSPMRKGKGKGKEIPSSVEDDHREKTPTSLEAVPRGRKRKRIASSSASGPFPQSLAERKSSLRDRGKLTSQTCATSLQEDDRPQPTLDKDVATPARIQCEVGAPSRSSSSLSSASKTKQSVLPVPAYRSLEPESVPPASHDHDSDWALFSDPLIPTTYSYSQQHPSHPPSSFSSPNQGTSGVSGVSLPTLPPLPLDPVQTQQTHYLLVQTIRQLSNLISATMPSYAAYTSNPGQPLHPPPHPVYSTPVHHSPRLHGTHHYHTPSSSVSRGLPPSSPVHSSLSPPVEEHRIRGRGRSRSRGRRVSFKLESGEVIGSREHNIQPELHHGEQKIRKPPLEVTREKGKGKSTEDRGTSVLEVTRGRTPGPPNRKTIDVSRSRSLSRR